jgi:hypothetical protein
MSTHIFWRRKVQTPNKNRLFVPNRLLNRSTTNVLRQNAMNANNTKSIIAKLERLSLEEAFIFQFYYTELIQDTALDLIPSKVGSTLHLNFLRQELSKDPSFRGLAQQLSSRKLQSFYSTAKRMASLAAQCKAAGITPGSSLPKEIQAKKPSLSASLKDQLDSNEVAPRCPHTKAHFEWYDFQRQPNPGLITISAHRFLFSSLVTQQDLKSVWMTKKHLRIGACYPDIMNYPVQLVDLVTDDSGQPVFDEQHQMVREFEKDVAPRRELDGGEKGKIWEWFDIHFKTQQDPRFVQVSTKCSGFHLLRAKYINSDNEVCSFKILQVVTKEWDPEEFRDAAPTADGLDIILGQKGRTVSSNLPFSPVRSPAPPNAYQPAPAPTPPAMPAPYHVGSSAPAPVPTPMQVPDPAVADLQAKLHAMSMYAAEKEREASEAAAAKESTIKQANEALDNKNREFEARENEYRQHWRDLEAAGKDAAAAAEVQRIAATRQEEVNQLQAELQRAQAATTWTSGSSAITLTPEQEREIADRDEIQKAMGNLGKRLRPTTGNHNDQARFGVHGADGQYLGVPAYVGNEEKDDERSEMSSSTTGFSEASRSVARVADF